MNQRDNVGLALAWVIGILDKHLVPYQVVGGLAATIHGGSRAVADIDLYIPEQMLEVVYPDLKTEAVISKPIKHYVEYGWDLSYLQLIYQEQKIEIGLSPQTKIYDDKNNEWVDLNIDYSTSIMKPYQDLTVAVMPVSQLIAYKRILNRAVDLIDISELEAL